MTEKQGNAELAVSDKPLDKMTVKELREVAKAQTDLSGISGMKKDELLAAVQKAKGIEAKAPKNKKKKTAGPKVQLTAKQLKEKLASFRKAMDENKDSMDSKERAIMRRRINRLKKRGRKAVSLR